MLHCSERLFLRGGRPVLQDKPLPCVEPAPPGVTARNGGYGTWGQQRRTIYTGLGDEMGRRTSVVACAAAILVAGCQTHLDVRTDGKGPYIHGDGDFRPSVGVEYGLPMLQFKLQVDRTLVQCVGKDDAGKPRVDIRFATKVSAEPHYVVGERFVIDYRSLANWSKTSAFTLETYDNGVIKSVNASAEDHTAAIIGDVVKTGINLASLSYGVPLVGNLAGPGKTEDRYRCNGDALARLKEIEDLKADLKTRTSVLTAATAKVAQLERLAGMGGLTETAKAELQQAQDQVVPLSKRVAATDARIAELLKATTVSEQVIWPKDMKTTSLSAAPTDHSLALIEKVLLETVGSGTDTRKGGRRGTADDAAGITSADLEAALELGGVLEALPTFPKQGTCADSDTDCGVTRIDKNKLSGLYYRNPVRAQLIICQLKAADGCAAKAASAVKLSVGVLAPQLGQLRVLPLTNGAFQNNALTAAFRENGGISKFTYDEKAARGKVISGAVAAGLDNIVAYRDARDAHKAKEEEAKQKVELDELDAEIARLERLKKIETLNAELGGDLSTQEMALETARLNAKIALLDAQRKVREAQEALDKSGP